MSWRDWLPEPFDPGRKTRNRILALTAEATEVDALYLPELRKLAKEKGEQSQDYLDRKAVYGHERSPYEDEIGQIESDQLLREAKKYYLDLADIVHGLGLAESWEEGHGGNSYLNSAAAGALRKAIHKAKREHEKETREKVAYWFGIAAGVVGLFIAAYSTFASRPNIDDLERRITAIEKLAAPAPNGR